MFEVDDILNYIPGGVSVTVIEVHDQHMIIKDNETDEILEPVYEDEYHMYEAA